MATDSNRPRTRLFHVHYNTPHVDELEAALASRGLPLVRRFGQRNGEHDSLSPDEPVPDDWQFRLETLRRGYVDLSLAPGNRHQFNHFGVCTASFDAVVERAEAAGWSVRDPAGRRTFLRTPWRFRVELHRDGDDVERSLGAWNDAHLSRIELVVPDDDAVRAGLRDVLGDVSGLDVRDGDGQRARVPTFELAGNAFPDRPTIDVEALADAAVQR